MKIIVKCRPSGQLDLPSLITLTRSCKCISFCRRSLMKLHMSHYCMESVRRAKCLPTLLQLKAWVIAGVEFSLGYPPYTLLHSPSKAWSDHPSTHARSRNHPDFATPAGTTHVVLISSPAFPLPISHRILNHSSINQRIENLLCTHKLHTPDLAHLALKPFALLIRYLGGTRNHQA